MTDYQQGAAVATALVNTLPGIHRGGDALPGPTELDRWLADNDLQLGRSARADVLAVHQLRAELFDAITAPDAATLAARAGRLTSTNGVAPVLTPDDNGRWQWQVAAPPGAGLAGRLALLTATGVLATLRSLGHDRFRECSSPACTGVFIDTSRAGRRRYCRPEVCGNRINVAAYRARLTSS
ncbi:CGNR zinc finger domain-containing protein [Pseudonocardia spinosispora]|uniref:CGNR zinc finger domain-containing protein n=1 Tax=Pseudonocardia spinosispora TaxID=103441 RepID=UPI001FE04BE3|nr:CGNR zinc finger domain-containing protein [Pseudonocardia spinosispora]